MELLNRITSSRDLMLLLTVAMLFLILMIVCAIILIACRKQDWAIKVIQLIKEIVLTCSSADSMLSMKRIQNWGIYGLVMCTNALYIFHIRNTITFTEFMFWSSGMFIAIGWGVKQIQSDKPEINTEVKP